MSERRLFGTLVFEACINLMVQWLYTEAGRLKLPTTDLCLKIKTLALHPPISAFIANTYRVHAFWKLTPHLIEVTSGHVMGICNAIYAVMGRPTLTDEETNDQELLAKIQTKIQEEITARYEETEDAAYATRYDLIRGISNLEMLARADDMDDAIYATFCAQITASWTAWETLATDLWEAAINCHPVTLAKLAGSKNRISKLTQPSVSEDDDDGAETKREFEPRLPDFERITKGTYNAGNVMGTLLRKEHRLQTLSGIRRAYSTAFSSNNREIDAALSDSALDKLNLVRNLITHKAGIADQTFVDRVASIPGWKIKHEVRKPLEIDGELVKELINPVFVLGTELIRAVDEWITPPVKANP